MRAARYDRYGPLEVLYEATVPRPVAGPGEVLVRVHAGSVNGGEPAARAGRLRPLTDLMSRGFPKTLGTAGTGMAAYRRLLAPGGRMVTISFDLDHLVPSLAYILVSTVYGSRRVRFFSGNPTHELFADLTRLVESGAIRPVVDTVHPLADIAEAHRALEAGGVRGKVVVRTIGAAASRT